MLRNDGISIVLGLFVACVGTPWAWAQQLAPTSPSVTHAPGAEHASSGLPSCYLEQARIQPNDVAGWDGFGYAAAVSGGTAVLGAPRADHFATDRGVAYVFVRDGAQWQQQAKLASDEPGVFDLFGAAVAVNGDTVLVGAPEDNLDIFPDHGSAWVFVRAGGDWTLQAKLTADDSDDYDLFGNAVAISGDTALVAALRDDDGGIEAGAVYVFVRAGGSWSRQAKLVADDSGWYRYFGTSVSLDGDTALVGMPGVLSGSAYVFVRTGTTWTQQAKLQASDGMGGDDLGQSVALRGDTALVGAPGNGEQGSNAGAAYVFVRTGSTWERQAKLLASDGAPVDRFGVSLSLDDDHALVGAHREDANGVDAGAAYLFRRGGSVWLEQEKFLASDGAAGDLFGFAVAFDDPHAVVGAERHSDPEVRAGAAYVYTVPRDSGVIYCTCASGPCGNSDAEAGCANSTGAGALLVARGSSLPDEVNLFVTGARPNQFAYFFQSDEAAEITFGDGLRCGGGTSVRLTSRPVQVGPDGAAAYGPCSGDPPISSVTGVVPGSGEILRYQFWYRDPSGSCGTGFNLSNGFEVHW